MVSVQIDRTECWLEFARAHARLFNLLSFLVCTRYASEILALVEVLASALLADNCLVTRDEPGKEFSVSVCHNSKFDLVNNRSRTQDLPRSSG
jgi:hypothetical protein